METKKAFRTSALSHIPMDWAKRKKLGFLVPFRVWLREDKYYNKVKEMFQKDFVSEFFNQELLLKWLEDHKNKSEIIIERFIPYIHSYCGMNSTLSSDRAVPK